RDAHLGHALAYPLLEQGLAWHPEAIEGRRLVVIGRALEPGAVAVDVLEILGDRARRQAAADAPVPRQARAAVGVEQARGARRPCLAAWHLARGVAPVVA